MQTTLTSENIQAIIEAMNKTSTSSETTINSQNTVHYYQYFLAVSLFLFLFILFFNPKKEFNI